MRIKVDTLKKTIIILIMIFKKKFYCFMRNNILLENVITGEKEEKEKPKADTKTRGKAIAMQI